MAMKFVAHQSVTGAAVLSSAPNPKTALQFMKFLASVDGRARVEEFHFQSSPILSEGRQT